MLQYWYSTLNPGKCHTVAIDNMIGTDQLEQFWHRCESYEPVRKNAWWLPSLKSRLNNFHKCLGVFEPMTIINHWLNQLYTHQVGTLGRLRKLSCRDVHYTQCLKHGETIRCDLDRLLSWICDMVASENIHSRGHIMLMNQRAQPHLPAHMSTQWGSSQKNFTQFTLMCTYPT